MAYGIQQITISDSYTVQDLYNCAVENYKEAKESTYKKKDREEFVFLINVLEHRFYQADAFFMSFYPLL